ncbi:hypothetical protein [Pseudomonas protegens]|uniref:hypothetical protein n=1 Tax=Pseudomonas protegens TaxID=380021 RepID=UPI000F474396|nr:hypothetical protein [Pseudomonas protegens]ROL94051.1 hypothetical protein BK639_16160 [Pseudomonas protegens]ROM00221.1 hypothetical protein BK641_26120 [Pseudomonas protegens]ROM03711.1 hypothetical protein BK640_12575 [Pseudomonas protegens]ROM11029.1 hypothetical protein BK642_06175 [Pseudomonas protegens]
MHIMKHLALFVAASYLAPDSVHALSFELEGTGHTVYLTAHAAYEELYVVSENVTGQCGQGDGTGQLWIEYKRRSLSTGKGTGPRVSGIKEINDIRGAYDLLFNRKGMWSFSTPISDVGTITGINLMGCKSRRHFHARIAANLNCSAGECWGDRPACSISGPGVLPLGRVAAGDNTQGTAYIAIQCSHPVTGRIRATGTGGTDQLVYSGDGLTGQVTLGGRPGSEGMLIEGVETATEAALGVATQASSAAAGGAHEAAIVVEFTAE